MRHHGRTPLPLTITAFLTLAALGGCASQRALPAVREAGDRAFRHQQFEVALSNYQEYLAREPGDPAVQLAMARALIECGRPAEAVEHAQLAYDQRPSQNEYIETLARALFESDHKEEMTRLLQSVADNRGLPDDFIRLGRWAAKCGDADGAEHALKQAATADGGRTVGPQLALADFYHTLGDRTGELRRLRMALWCSPNSNEIKSRIRGLGEIPGPSVVLRPDEFGLVRQPSLPAPKDEATVPDSPGGN